MGRRRSERAAFRRRISADIIIQRPVGGPGKVCGAGDLDLYDGGIFSRRGSIIFSKQYQKEQPQEKEDNEEEPSILGDSTDLGDGMIFTGNRFSYLFVRFDAVLGDTMDLYDGGLFSYTGNAVFSKKFNEHNPVDILGDTTDLLDSGIFDEDEIMESKSDTQNFVDLDDAGIFDADSSSDESGESTVIAGDIPMAMDWDCN